MILTIIIAFLSLLFLVITHELGHFLVAKKFGIKVEEFGIGYPPRIWGKKYGETLYSINWIPFGAFVRIYGHEERINDPRSFSSKPIWQRALVILGGVISFWIIAWVIMSVVMALGVPTIVSDNEIGNLVDPKIQIIGISASSPASKAGFQIGDALVSMDANTFDKVENVQEFIKANRGKEIDFKIRRGGSVINIKATPRLDVPENEGALGVSLVKTALISYPWYEAPIKGAEATWNLTIMTLDGWKSLFSSLFRGRGVPAGMETRGVIGIFDLFIQASGLGVSYFLQFIAVIAVSLALFNALPIPALDGGWFVLLIIEGIMGKPLPEKIERGVSAAFFFLLIGLMIFITIKDILRFF